MHCSLATSKRYVLTESYEDDLHIHFANAETDQALTEFVCDWGPLYITTEQRGAVSMPLNYCRAFQRWLRTLVDLLAAFRHAAGEQEALQKYIIAEIEYGRSSPLPIDESMSLVALRHRFGISGDIVDWVKGLNLRLVRSASDFLVSFAAVGPKFSHLVCRRKGARRQVEASWIISSLEDALRWMVWYDEFTRHPILCCQECRKVFRGKSAHVRKYCSPECAHRATGRNWQRKMRLETKRRKSRRAKGK